MPNQASVGNDIIVSYFGLKDLQSFKETFIAQNRGKPLFLIRFENLKGLDVLDFLARVREHIKEANNLQEVRFGFHIMDSVPSLLMGIVPFEDLSFEDIPNLDSTLGMFHANSLQQGVCQFDFGIARTVCNWVSDVNEIYDGLEQESRENLEHNQVRWKWTHFNRANTYFSRSGGDALIQPTVAYDPETDTFSVVGGEVFVGGGYYQSYRDLLKDIPERSESSRVELLILEKLIWSSKGAPGMIKFNISPQSLLDVFKNDKKVRRLHEMVLQLELDPANIRFELIEEHFREEEVSLVEVCHSFWNHGFSFAADDFGLNSSSHQIALNLGKMITEFKLDPMSFKFKPEEDNIKFLDNMAFLDYCHHLANNRNAVITAEAVDDYDTLRFLMEHHVYHFQTFLFSDKMAISEYIETYPQMQKLPAQRVKELAIAESEGNAGKANLFLRAKA